MSDTKLFSSKNRSSGPGTPFPRQTLCSASGFGKRRHPPHSPYRETRNENSRSRHDGSVDCCVNADHRSKAVRKGHGLFLCLNRQSDPARSTRAGVQDLNLEDLEGPLMTDASVTVELERTRTVTTDVLGARLLRSSTAPVRERGSRSLPAVGHGTLICAFSHDRAPLWRSL